jgi:hypothetical protein
VGSAGPLRQGDVPASNMVFRAPRYAQDGPELYGQDLTPGDPLELHGAVLLVDGSTAVQRVQPGGSAELAVRSPQDAGKFYLVATSLTEGLVPLDARFLRVGLDPLLLASISNVFPEVFRDTFGVLDPSGRAVATLAVPALKELVGAEFRSLFVVVDPLAWSGIGTISNTVVVRIE